MPAMRGGACGRAQDTNWNSVVSVVYHIPHSRRAETLELSHFVVYDGLKHLKKTLELSHFVVYDGFKHLRGVHKKIAADVDKEGCFSVDGRGIIRGR